MSLFAEAVSLQFGSTGTLSGNLYLNGASDFIQVQNVGVASICTTVGVDCTVGDIVASYILPSGAILRATTGNRQTPNPLVFNSSSGAFDVFYNAPSVANLGVYNGLTTLLGGATPAAAKISFQPGVLVSCSNPADITTCRAASNSSNFGGRLVTGSFSFERAIDFATLDPAIAAALNIVPPLTGQLPLKISFNGRFAYAGTTGLTAGLIYNRTGALAAGAAFRSGEVTLDAANPVPEPSSLALAGAGLVLVAFARRRHRRAQAH